MLWGYSNWTAVNQILCFFFLHCQLRGRWSTLFGWNNFYLKQSCDRKPFPEAKSVNWLFFIFLTLCHNPVALSTGSKHPWLTEHRLTYTTSKMVTERMKLSMEATTEAAADFASKAALLASKLLKSEFTFLRHSSVS